MSRSLFVALLILPVGLVGQTTLKYQLTNINPGFTIYTLGKDPNADAPLTTGVLVYNMRSVQQVSLSTRDSAGGVLWEATADTAVRSIDVLDSVWYARSSTPRMPPMPTQVKPITWRMLVREGKVELLERNGVASKAVFSPENPAFALLSQFSGLSLLKPKGGFPAKGVSRTDSTASVTDQAARDVSGARGTVTMPGGKKYDTTIVRLKHTKGDTLSVSSYVAAIGPSSRNNITGSQEIVIDPKGQIVSVSSTSTTVYEPISETMRTLPMKTVTTVTLKRIP